MVSRPGLDPGSRRFNSVRRLVNTMEWSARSRRKPSCKPRAERPRCDARTRRGTPCKAHVVWDHVHDRLLSNRCKLHGGAGTGPRTAEGREAIRESASTSHLAGTLPGKAALPCSTTVHPPFR